MPLNDGYGVIIGDLEDYYRDDVNDYGQYYHGNIIVKAPDGTYRCAVDVDSKKQQNGVEWRIVELGKSNLKGLVSLSDGWHSLNSNSSSGAIDYIRSKELQPRGIGCLPIIFNPLIALILKILNSNIKPSWKSGTSIDALADLEPLLENPKKLYIFGEPFTSGKGVHNIHQNQGDPEGSQWWDENGIWQDGITIIKRQDDSLVAFLNKFKTQSYETDEFGHPI